MLSGLEQLFIRDNQLDELPADIGKLSQLAILNVQGNNLYTIPPSIVSTKLDGVQSKLLMAGNPLAKAVVSALKKGGVHGLFRQMKEHGWETEIAKTD